MGRSILLGVVFMLALCTCDVSAQEFHGFSCPGDCGGHEAGYAWAREREVTREAQCQRSSVAFYEGCAAWAREYRSGYDRARTDDVRDASECDGTDAEISGC